MSSKIALVFLIGCCVLLGLGHAQQTNRYNQAQRRTIHHPHPQAVRAGHRRNNNRRTAEGYPIIKDDPFESGPDPNDGFGQISEESTSPDGADLAGPPGPPGSSTSAPSQVILASGNKDRFARRY